MRIRNYRDADFDAIVRITLLAFAPIHEPFRQILGKRIFDLVYPDWKKSHREYVASLCKSDDSHNILVAEDEGRIIGFASYLIHT